MPQQNETSINDVLENGNSPTNDNHAKIIFGQWIVAVGTIFAVIATTQRTNIVEATRSDYSIYGNALEAAGNAIIADGIAEASSERTGTYIQTFGNLTALYADISDIPDDVEITLNIKGSLLEALGTSYAIFGSEPLNDPSRRETISLYGGLLQLFGNFFEAFGGFVELRGGEGESFFEIGTILQAIGAIVTAVFYEGDGERF
ncbi:DUF6944 family repetitive protein [Shouchella patagoniensis]|uniref:DUF6944 family repetitive protein n=1 Tax=Shouchella patagoniensis TaxID=228576 RepID=UPI000994D4B0|nr:hypothetical protein [Shouchella patagoniensis]